MAGERLGSGETCHWDTAISSRRDETSGNRDSGAHCDAFKAKTQKYSIQFELLAHATGWSRAALPALI